MLGSHHPITQCHILNDRILSYTAIKPYNSAINSLYKVTFPTGGWAVKGHSTDTYLSYSTLRALLLWIFYRPLELHSLFITNTVQRNFSPSKTQSICVNFTEWCTWPPVKIYRNIHSFSLMLACMSAHSFSPTVDMNFNCWKSQSLSYRFLLSLQPQTPLINHYHTAPLKWKPTTGPLMVNLKPSKTVSLFFIWSISRFQVPASEVV
jgi:hypothetical protein